VAITRSPKTSPQLPKLWLLVRMLHCGRRPYLHDDLATIRLPDSLVAAPLLELWPVVVRRCEVPADVEQMVSRLQQPHNPAVERTVGSHSLAAAAHRER
jgi:hypothetical protein